jgi:hypothetical protein
MSGINFSKTRPTLENNAVVYPIAQLYYGTATSITDLNTRFPNAANNGYATLPSSEAVFRNGSWQEVASGGGAPSKYKGRYTNLPAIQAAHPNPSDADYAYNTAGTLRFYALNGTWQSEVLSFTPPAAAEQYADSQELFTAQGNQVNGATYEVVDASDDPNVLARGGSSTAFYKYLGVSNQSYSDYELLPATEVAQPQFNAIVDLGDVSGAITIDWNDAIKHKMNITGNSTITFTNFAAYEGIKVQELQIKSSSPSNTITWSNGVDISLLEGDTIDFSSTGKVNNISVRLLRTEAPDGVFQISNLVR